ncbi:hypothetical protein CDL15_Pgr003868 [Punica granatum]|uniref:TF-B3 domain-containing protein n=1 Tax=Punica granatum TaxID=22663 RepID=A0A218XUZ9_PUNGR|nr:hypothetical protein CDL15_Pgr003868 [Punica granatum]
MAEEETEPKHSPSFFKVLIDKPSTRLKLPPPFVRENIQWNLHETISLKKDLGVSWKVKMEEDETGCYFTKGWVKFVKDMRLEVWDFLIFWLICAKEFKVAFYGKNSCERDISYYASCGTRHSSKLLVFISDLIAELR